MKRWTGWLVAAFVLCTSIDSEAASRLGGGRSVGRQSSNVTQREAGQAPARPAAPGTVQKDAQAQPAPAQAAAPAAPKPGFGGMLGGLAAGLGLAWLAHSLGLGAAFGNFLLVLLAGLLAVGLVTAFMRSRRPAAAEDGYAFQAPGAAAQSAPLASGYNPDKIGNDASARPWERNSMAFEAGKYGASGVRIGSALQGSQGWGVPAGFDAEGFLAAARRNFLSLQDAWDRCDIPLLRTMMTDEMVGEIQGQLAERQAKGGARTHTAVDMLDAQLLGIEELDAEYMASVEFSGMIREDPSAGPSPFREVWNMVKPRDGSAGWLVAGVQALQ